MAFNELTLIMLYAYANVLLSMYLCVCVCVTVFVECANVCLVCVFSLRSIEFFCGNWSNCNSQSWHRFVSWFTHSVLGPLPPFPRSLTAPATRSEALHICMERSFNENPSPSWPSLCLKSFVCNSVKQSNRKQTVVAVAAALCCCCVSLLLLLPLIVDYGALCICFCSLC